ncbi:hypothetical protein KSP39_PZI007462 [Platanthera zijinensis]|uniref:MCM10 OB-fold domain-containing protein n=1 Tax=Platanthera zijinensis TaxID=2320716 RepID=A0AAP0BRN5_9ASPA
MDRRRDLGSATCRRSVRSLTITSIWSQLLLRNSKTKIQKKDGEVETERFSGLRIRNQLVSSVEPINHFFDVRFVWMNVVRNLLSRDTLSGSWATVGVLTEKMGAKVSSTGKNYGIWKMSCLDEIDIFVFLFGNAYKTNYS